ncbi:MAG: hypothetical protein HLUCCX10_11335 [Algoriphagus marincola HL-49]|uniref:Uncharacterized protein n=1 Tax=Algoriphagus marincola HL-49 TaxID=1305737 RepID=A0A0P8AF15_9BACT|nr:MAG: hypothetical protein HLUCCX10_11335 [Algoriphagus marincola HL-49]
MQQFYISMISLGWMVLSHPFYISLTEIRQNPNSNRLEIATKIFWDDLEVGLSSFHEETIDFLNPDDPEMLQQQVEAYLKENFQIWIAEKEINWVLLGFEVEEDAAWFYLESDPVKLENNIRIKNSVLIEDFSTQQNIIHVYQGNSRSPRSLLLGKGQETDELKLK